MAQVCFRLLRSELWGDMQDEGQKEDQDPVGMGEGEAEPLGEPAMSRIQKVTEEGVQRT